MANEPLRYNAGIVTAYGAAVRGGYTGTYEEFCQQQADYAETAAAVAQAKVDAEAAARRAEAAVESYDEMTAAATGLPHGSDPTSEIDRTGGHPVLRLGIPDGAKGDDGYSPTVSITTITGGHRITITDKTGDHTADILDGDKGDPGDDGYSPTVAITDITGGHRITITDKTGSHTADVMDGDKGDPGDDGFSPTVTVTNITGGHRVTITDAQGAHTFDVMDGEDSAVLSVNGKTGPVVLDGADINVNNSASTPKTVQEELGDLNRALNAKYEKPSGGIPASDLASGVIPSVPVQDVQVAGTSILQEGVANVPIGTNSRFGVVQTNNSYGTQTYGSGANQKIGVLPATDEKVKAGTENYHTIAPGKQHVAAFYGLAKIAGADEKNSSLPAGQYTESAKSAIQSMLGVEGYWEKVADQTVTEATAEVEVLMSRPSKHILLFIVTEPTVGSTTLSITLKNETASTFYLDLFASQINTTQKTTIVEYEMLDENVDGYILRTYNLDNSASQARRSIIKKNGIASSKSFNSVSLKRYSGDPVIEAGSKIIIWAK